jgi:MoxR-like ATPase
MEEHQVTVDGVTYDLPRPFMVLATQNPIEYEGTFPLPEAQLDRFMLRIKLGYPSRDDEVTVLDRQQFSHPVEALEQVITAEELVAAQAQVREIEVRPVVRQYIVDLVTASRSHPDVYLGASPRGSLALFRAVQARALLRGQESALPDDVKLLAEPALAHRLIVKPSARVRGVGPTEILEEILGSVPVPGNRVFA